MFSTTKRRDQSQSVRNLLFCNVTFNNRGFIFHSNGFVFEQSLAKFIEHCSRVLAGSHPPLHTHCHHRLELLVTDSTILLMHTKQEKLLSTWTSRWTRTVERTKLLKLECEFCLFSKQAKSLNSLGSYMIFAEKTNEPSWAQLHWNSFKIGSNDKLECVWSLSSFEPSSNNLLLGSV